jgi:hypothetical protein
MASSYSDLKIELIGTGDQSGTWGTTTNNNLGTALGEAITGSADVSFSSADVTVTLTDTNAAQTARNLRLNLTGTSGGARNLILGSGCQIEKLYLINNGLADTVTVKNTSGTGIAVPAGKTMFVYNNGTNVVDAMTHATSLTLGSALPVASGGTGTSTAFTTGSVVFAGASGVYSQDNANLFWDDTNNFLGIGTTTPTQPLTIYNSTNASGPINAIGDGNSSSITNTRYTSDQIPPQFSTQKARGTFASPTVAVSGDQAGQFISRAFAGTNFRAITNIVSIVDTVVSDTNISGSLAFNTNGGSTGTTERMRIDSAGNVGIGTSSPSYRLTIQSAAASALNRDNVIRVGDQTNFYRNSMVYNGSSSAIGAFPALSGGIYWELGGGFGASGGLVLATNSANAGPVIFGTADTERMRITSAGDVGIGTTSPAGSLEVYKASGSAIIQATSAATTGSDIARLVLKNGTLEFQSFAYAALGAVVSGAASNHSYLLYTNNTERMKIDTSGNVGIGTTSPSARLETNVASGNNEFRMGIAGTTSAQFIASTTDFTFVNNRNGAQVFFNNGSERMRIDSSGNVGIGTSSPGTKLDVNGQRIKINNATDPGIEFHNASTVKGYVFYDTTNDFMTMRHNSTSTGVSVNSSGNVLVGTTASNGKLSTETASATQRTIHAASNGGSATTDGVYYGFVNQARGTGFNFMAFQNTSAVDFKVLGNGNVQNTNNSYGAISDVKLKENIVDATPKLDDLMKVKVRHYNFIDDESKTKQIGVVAQEIEQVFSGIVENIPDRDEEGNTLNSVTKSVKYSVFVPMLIKAIQEQTQIINDLKARIETLETK